MIETSKHKNLNVKPRGELSVAAEEEEMWNYGFWLFLLILSERKRVVWPLI